MDIYFLWREKCGPDKGDWNSVLRLPSNDIDEDDLFD